MELPIRLFTASGRLPVAAAATPLAPSKSTAVANMNFNLNMFLRIACMYKAITGSNSYVMEVGTSAPFFRKSPWLEGKDGTKQKRAGI
jgi:hypothetical protein